MNDPHDENDFAETAILEDRQIADENTDPEATVVLGDEYRRELARNKD